MVSKVILLIHIYLRLRSRIDSFIGHLRDVLLGVLNLQDVYFLILQIRITYISLLQVYSIGHVIFYDILHGAVNFPIHLRRFPAVLTQTNNGPSSESTIYEII